MAEMYMRVVQVTVHQHLQTKLRGALSSDGLWITLAGKSELLLLYSGDGGNDRLNQAGVSVDHDVHR